MGRIEGGTDGTEDGRLLCPPAMVVWTSLFVSGATDERRGRGRGRGEGEGEGAKVGTRVGGLV